ncbi:udp-glucose 6-dehydrogenase [Tricladium varicosporioides]|nr:udp-glucose 6-dehydrogenase [Hymenoscyphus varicosporioides]
MPPPALTISSDDVLNDISTAPTTPDGSLTFSPVLQALRLREALEDNSRGKGRSARAGERSAPVLLSSVRSSEVENICCVGAGYVGGPTAAMIAFQNPHIKVTVVDRDSTRIDQWKSKHLPIHEPGLQSLIRIVRDGAKDFSFPNQPSQSFSEDTLSSSSRTSSCTSQCSDHDEQLYFPSRTPNLFFSTEVASCIADADIVMIAVNTPTKKRGLGAGRATNMTALEAVTRVTALNAKPGAIIVEKSTVPCQTADMIQNIFKSLRPEAAFEVLSNPEFLAEGTAIQDLLHPSRILIGSSSTPSGKRAAEALSSVYRSWVPKLRIKTINTYSSELAKLSANAFLAQRISSINSISAICEATGADISEISQSVGLDSRIGSQFLKAGVGFGGSCFKKDILSLCYIATSCGLPEVAQYWEQVLKINEWQGSRFVRRVLKHLNGTLVAKKLAVLGFAFKGGTGDVRESPSMECIKELLEDEPKEVAIFDPYCKPQEVKDEIERTCGKEVLSENGGPVEIYMDPYEACAGSHAVLVMTDAKLFRTLKSPSHHPSGLKDPRPFDRLQPTESEVFELEVFLEKTFGISDPLQRYVEEPECSPECRICDKTERNANEAGTLHENLKLDWARIAYHLATPKLVFDGKGVLDADIMIELGVNLVSVGVANDLHGS